MKGYKIFFSSTSLSLKSKPIAGLKINRKPVVGFNQKNCQLFSGRGTLSLNTLLLFIRLLIKVLFTVSAYLLHCLFLLIFILA